LFLSFGFGEIAGRKPFAVFAGKVEVTGVGIFGFFSENKIAAAQNQTPKKDCPY
jgi:hypothetical protein